MIDRDRKIEWIYQAAQKHRMSPVFLYGVLDLESMVTDLGVIKDGDNYSCGPGSLNVSQWCEWMVAQPASLRAQLNWPEGVTCGEDWAVPSSVGVLFNNADVRGGASAATDEFHSEWPLQLRHREASAVPDSVALAALDSAYDVHGKNAALWLQAIRSFADHCSDPMYSIDAVAFSLKEIYRKSVPAYLKHRSVAMKESRGSPACRYTVKDVSPLDPAWLFAYGVHNQGDELVDDYRSRFGKKAAWSLHYDFLELLRDLNKTHYFMSAVNIDHVLIRMMTDGSNPSPDVD